MRSHTNRYTVYIAALLLSLVGVLLVGLVFRVQEKRLEAVAIVEIWEYGGAVYSGKHPVIMSEESPPGILAGIQHYALGDNFFVTVDRVIFIAMDVDSTAVSRYGCSNGVEFNDDLIDSLKSLPDLKNVEVECSQSVTNEQLECAREALPNVSFQ